jgi:soluble lytic murein transglycosylase-like protein
MKTAAKILILSASMAFAQHFINLDAPKPIQVKAPTEQSIREELKREQRLRQYKSASIAASKVYRKNGCKPGLAEITGRIAVEQGISARVLAALVFVESSCNPNVVSRRDGVGLTQVNSKVWHYSQVELKNPNRNLEIGASILASYVRRYGLKEGLHAYNGFGNHTNSYAEKVLIAAGIQAS